MLATYSQQFPTVRFAEYPWWSRLFHGIRFLPHALRSIEARKLNPTYSIHFLSSQQRLLGISDGDIRYPAGHDELRRLHPIVIQLEDKRFFTHGAVDIRGIARALVANLRAGRIVQGGSTITQQLVRNTLLVPERSLLRKILEVILAIRIEQCYTKREILDLYCNHVFLGRGLRGFPAAAKIIYRKRLAALDVGQIYGLAGLLRTPTRTYPVGNGERFCARQQTIARILNPLDSNTDTVFARPNPVAVTNFRCPRFTSIVTAEVARLTRAQPRDMRRVGLTIDSKVQSAITETFRGIASLPDVESVAGIVLSTRTGDVLAESAFSGGRESHFSPAYFGSLQPGSTFKTFAVLAALDQGISIDHALTSAPFESACFQGPSSEPWRVRNYANVYRGVISLKEAFRHSDNTAFARLVEQLDCERMYAVYKSFGLSQGGELSPAIVLGGHEKGVGLLALAAAYRAIANGGSYVRPRFIQHIEYENGEVSWIPRSQPVSLVSSFQVLRQLQLALEFVGNAIGGGGYSGKTGTTRTGSLIAAYDDHLASAIWVGYTRSMTEGDPKAVGATTTLERLLAALLGHRTSLLSI